MKKGVLEVLGVFMILFLLAACSGNGSSSSTNTSISGESGQLDEERIFDNNVWNSQTPEVFEIDITDPDAYYTITVAVTIDTAIYRYEDFPFYANIFTPDGAHRHLSPSFPVKQYGRWKGEMRDGYRVITKQLYDFFPFSKAGKQRIEVKQATSQYNLEGIHAFSINIKKADIDFEKMRNQI